MTQSIIDHSFFYHHTSFGQYIYPIVDVDDIVITRNNLTDFQNLKQHLFSHFQTKGLRKHKYFLGIEVPQSKYGIVISQRKYALDILQETGLLDCKSIDTRHTPMHTNVKFVPGQGKSLPSPRKYCKLVGKLNYQTFTRSEISFPVSVVS